MKKILAFASFAFAAEIHIRAGDSIQAAINDANNNDVIIVHEGTYIENIKFLGKVITVKGTDPNDSAVVAATIIDGGRAGSVVTFESKEKSNSMLRGFTVQRAGIYFGGGIYCESSSPTITGNSAKSGGGIYLNESSPTITNCTITGNSTKDYGDGGGIYCISSSPTITNCTITRNSAKYRGLTTNGTENRVKNFILA